ncbi:FAD-linked oxidase C-terminal domain-containing protein [Escherichia coli]|uniref:FAD-linked oxidase C-terminal domain-containing protein n=1 Tax=Escherichia coli TaxID=562 RepID=UPI0011C78B4C|nr:FAD-linked oxidase C-terminal domain-containing protein [Escherichia coli]TXP00380.1 glycolate oxidase subunit GlcD [Escherichia coli]
MLNLFVGLDIYTGLLLLLALAFVLFYEAINGFHDTANAVATVIYTRAMQPQLAVVMAAFFNFFGVLLGGLSVAYAIVHMLPTDLLLNMGSTHGLAMVFSMLLAAIIWNLGTWFFGLPASSSHTLAENAGGVHCLKYGLTVHNLLKIEVQTLDGEALTLGSDALDSPGFDLLALFTGSEGMLGVTTEVTVKLLPKPPVARVLLASFDSVEKAGLAVGDIIANGIIPGGLEMMDNLSIRAAEDFIHAGYPVDAEAILLCELDGVESDVQEDCERVNDILLKAGATDVRLAQDEAERVRFWAGRKNAFPAVGRISPDYYCMDGTIPRRALPGVLEGIARLSQQYDLRVANVFHAGDGNMHPLILFDANEPGEFARAEELGGKILELCVEVGGSISGEHGIGREKINQMCAQFNSDEITTFHAVKAAFDPDGLLNPGKNIPTLHRCAEFGAMHVHHGHLPFPELERF